MTITKPDRVRKQLLAARAAWLNTARAEQLPPKQGHFCAIAGRGWGKSRAAAEAVVSDMLAIHNCRAAVIGQTLSDARETMLEGESGIISVLRRYGFKESQRPTGLQYHWNRWNGELFLGNGSQCRLYSSERPDKLRGPQHHVVLFDELAAFQKPQETWDQAQFGLRLGEHPRWYVTTTPRPIPTVRQALNEATKVSRGSTFDNEANLPDSFLKALRTRYEGTRLGRQELYAELLEDVPGALWTLAQIEADRVWGLPYPGGLKSAVVGLDPSDASGEGDEFGLCVAGQGWDAELYVVESMGLQDGPLASLRTAVEQAQKWNARIVMEKNHGGAYLVATLEQVMREIDVRVGYEVLHVKESKKTRAEPIAALFEQHRVHMVGVFAGLEDQLVNWSPGDSKSPDRMDSMIHSLTPFLQSRLSFAGDDSDVTGVRYGDVSRWEAHEIAGEKYWDEKSFRNGWN